MSARRLRQNLRFLIVLAALIAVGLLSAGYVLLHERLPNPFVSSYEVSVAFPAADGVVPGLGQPVNVAGVQAGSITGARLADGSAILTLNLQRNEVPHVYSNAQAALDPITPLGDVELNLDPGKPPAPELRPGATLENNGASPVPLSTLLSSLDTDTRDWLSSLIVSMGQATAKRGTELRRALLALGPTVAQLRGVTGALARRRQALARLVHNLAIVTKAASQDDQLATVVRAGDETLHSVASQDAALSSAVQQLPSTLGAADRTLGTAATFADELRPAADALLPGIRGLPRTLTLARPFALQAANLLQQKLRPLVIRAQPIVRSLGPATADLSALAPAMTSVLQVANYALNELAYNPGGNDPGFLFWLAWTAQNWNSAFGFGDAHGAFGRAEAFVSCNQLTNLGGFLDEFFSVALGVADICPGS